MERSSRKFSLRQALELILTNFSFSDKILYRKQLLGRRPKCNKLKSLLHLEQNVITLKLRITVITQIIAAFGGNLISAAVLIRVNTVQRGITMVLSAALK